MFSTPPAKRRPGYANFAISDRCQQQAHLQVQAEPQTTCCYALQDKILVKEMKPPILTRPPTMFSYDCPPRISGN